MAAAADGSGDLNVIGPFTVEQHRIQAETTRQEVLVVSSAARVRRLVALIAQAEKYPRYERCLVADTETMEMLLDRSTQTSSAATQSSPSESASNTSRGAGDSIH